MLQTWVEKTVICVCICVSLYMILHYIRILLNRFAIPVDGAMTGKFERGEDLTTGVASGVKDANEIATLSTLIHTQACWSSPCQTCASHGSQFFTLCLPAAGGKVCGHDRI